VAVPAGGAGAIWMGDDTGCVDDIRISFDSEPAQSNQPNFDANAFDEP